MTKPATIGRPDLSTHQGFILAEDEALKRYLTGWTVPESPGSTKQTKVGVWFRFPESERQIHYPFMTLDLLTVEPMYDLFTSYHLENPRGLYHPSVRPDLPPLTEGMEWNIPMFLPFRLIYQIMVHCRSALHDRYLLSLFATDVFPPRPFWLKVGADNTWRRTERLAFNAADMPETTESGTKRIFRKVYTVSLMAEIPQSSLWGDEGALYKVLRVLIPVVDREMFDKYFESILDGHPNPLDEFTPEERVEKGEYTHVWHEGVETPSLQ